MSIGRTLKYTALLLLIAILFVGIWYLKQSDEDAVTDSDYEWVTALPPEHIEYNGALYAENNAVTTILIGGVDQDEPVDLSGGNGTGGQVDMLMLFVINSETKTIERIQIDRDTMTSIQVLNENFLVEGTRTGQIALSHAYGNGGSISCKNAVAAVETLFHGVRVDEYFFMNMGAIPTLNDFVGGVEVRIRDDFSEVDPTLRKGRTIRLNGSQAYNYLHARKLMDEPTNENRMKRINTYMDKLVTQLETQIRSDVEAGMIFYDQIADYTSTSLSASELAALVLKTDGYTYNDIIIPEGTFAENTELEEFYVDEEKLTQMIFELFYEVYTEE